jgi:hypothetical protein
VERDANAPVQGSNKMTNIVALSMAMKKKIKKEIENNLLVDEYSS